MGYNLLFFTVATGRYKIYITPYIFCALYNNPNARAEIMTDNSIDYKQKSLALPILEKQFPERFLIREIPKGIEPHTARFVCEPITKLEYTYINDVDIMILESNLVETHTGIMAAKQSIFSNRMRGTHKLTGCQFVKTAQYYKMTARARATTKLKDEHALYDIVNRGIGRPQIWTSELRPIHGFHLSPNREPIPAPGLAGWKMGPEPLRLLYRVMIQSRKWQEIQPYFDREYNDLLKTLNGYVK